MYNIPWNSKDAHEIRVKTKAILARNMNGKRLTVSMPKDKAMNLLFLRFLDQHP